MEDNKTCEFLGLLFHQGECVNDCIEDEGDLLLSLFLGYSLQLCVVKLRKQRNLHPSMMELDRKFHCGLDQHHHL